MMMYWLLMVVLVVGVGVLVWVQDGLGLQVVLDLLCDQVVIDVFDLFVLGEIVVIVQKCLECFQNVLVVVLVILGVQIVVQGVVNFEGV